ncbi:MAG: IS110 family transposase [Candidatus Zixiibacteriota bacterium]
MRKMQEHIVKGKRVFVGLEDSKRTWKLCVRCEGMIVHETSMPAEYENLRGYLRSRYPKCEVQLIYEAGFSGFWLCDLLTQEGIDCVVTPPHKVTEEKVNRVKVDKTDARRLAKTLEVSDYTRCWIPDRAQREDRQVVRTLTQVQRDIVVTKNRIRRFLDWHGLNGEMPSGRWRDRDYERVKEFRFRPSLQVCLDTYLRRLDDLKQTKSDLLGELRSLSKKERYSRLVESKRRCPGVGWLSAIRFTLEWGDLSRFEDDKRFGSYLGLTASEESSGDTVHRGRITHQGNPQVRSWLVECAWRAIRIDPALLNKFRKVWQNTGSKKKAIVAVARKLAIRMRAVELSDEPYQLGVIR